MSRANRRERGPPAVPFVLAVGVTGHRSEVLNAKGASELRERIREVLSELERSGRALLAAEPACFAETPLRMRFVSPLADGADQIAAEIALELGWELEAVLPFERGQYRALLPMMPRASLSTSCWRRRPPCLSCRASRGPVWMAM